MSRNPFSFIWSRTAGARQFGKATGLGFLGILTWVPVFFWVERYVFEITVINGASMYPLLNGDKDSTTTRDVLLNWKWNAREDLERGMVVTLRSPTNPRAMAIKRVVALEGDVIKTKEPYPVANVKVPREHVWVEGDGEQTHDSNAYGPVSKRMITGRLNYRLYPFSNAGELNWRERQRPLVKRAEDFPPEDD